MSEYTSYYLYQKYQKIGDGDWTPVSPSVFSVNGDGTMPLSAKTENDPNCGYSPEPIYDWENMDVTTDYYCLDCGSYSPKVSGKLSGGTTFSVNCNSSSTLTSGETRPYSGMTYAKLGICITEIGTRAFSNRPGLSGVTIPNTVTTIGESAFTNSNALFDCVLPDSVTTIGNSAFNNCTSLTNFALWNNITSIGNGAFQNCDSLISINIPTGLTSISVGCFNGCGALSEVTIPSGVTTIGNNSFSECIGLTSIDIPSGVTSIGNSAFYGCSGLTSITLNAITPPTLGNTAAFTYTNDCPIYVPCESVDDYISAWPLYANRIQGIPPSAEVFKFKATYTGGTVYSVRCDSNTTLTTATTKPSGSQYQYYGMATAEIGNCVTSLGNDSFRDCTSLSSITMSKNITTIGSYAFYHCRKLTGITIPTGITAISAHTFDGCIELSNVDIPSGVTVIGTGAFEYCSASTFTSVTIPDSTTEIGTAAFLYCRFLRSVYIGNGITKIGRNAFAGCVNLTSVTVTATTPPTLTDTGAFNDSTCPIYVPAASVNAYKASWTEYASRITAIQ